ncbi:CotS family spore coat protein [Clostridium sp. MB40-C1]|uniref:CotS family spore coat protein n=1 Tax=Clostridium sp. MB40-C1 TaxID=3070996 RepID=UPI0027DF3C26|nr:CotS family spore coat protein [Clostridium sp. MB40-C1]WMJ81927.1 CotS family spore coat protein [Clostridium sp. MB40-C1]
MGKNSKHMKYNEIISDKEDLIIKKVLDRYNIEVIDYKKVRSAYKVRTPKGHICLKKFSHGRNKAANGSFLVEALSQNNFHNTATFMKTQNDNLFVRYKNYFFYTTEWIDGEECDFSNLEEAKKCASLLAKFHLTTSKIDTKDLKIKNNLKNWTQIYKKKLYDLPSFKKIISNKKIKNEFDKKYSEHIDEFYKRGLLTLSILNNSEYYRLSKEAEKKHTICHNSFYYQNIIKKDNKYYIIDLDSITIDLQVNDLGKFIRRLMSKHDYKWDFQKAKQIIEGYNSINKLSKSELEVMLAIIVFPHKFWKLGRKRYVKCKHWSEERYYRKLNKILSNMTLEEKFLEDYIKFLDSYTY